MLLLLSKDGTAKARCVECSKLVEVPPSSSGYAICPPCKAEVDRRYYEAEEADFPGRWKRRKA